MWTKVTNPNTDGFVKVTNPDFLVNTTTAGSPIGLLLALTYATTTAVTVDPWMKVTNPNTDNWAKVTGVSNGSWTPRTNPLVDNWTKVTNPS